MNLKQIHDLIICCLTDDLLSPNFKKLKRNNKMPNTFGHCYVASEAAYYLLGGKKEGWKPMYIKHLGISHWFLKHKSGIIFDVTSGQFQIPVDYKTAKGIGFLTKVPSKRTKTLLIRIKEQSNHKNSSVSLTR